MIDTSSNKTVIEIIFTSGDMVDGPSLFLLVHDFVKI